MSDTTRRPKRSCGLVANAYGDADDAAAATADDDDDDDDDDNDDDDDDDDDGDDDDDDGDDFFFFLSHAPQLIHLLLNNLFVAEKASSQLYAPLELNAIMRILLLGPKMTKTYDSTAAVSGTV